MENLHLGLSYYCDKKKKFNGELNSFRVVDLVFNMTEFVLIWDVFVFKNNRFVLATTEFVINMKMFVLNKTAFVRGGDSTGRVCYQQRYSI